MHLFSGFCSGLKSDVYDKKSCGEHKIVIYRKFSMRDARWSDICYFTSSLDEIYISIVALDTAAAALLAPYSLTDTYLRVI